MRLHGSDTEAVRLEGQHALHVLAQVEAADDIARPNRVEAQPRLTQRRGNPAIQRASELTRLAQVAGRANGIDGGSGPALGRERQQVFAEIGGQRLCAFFWIQSMVRDDSQRSILFDLDQSKTLNLQAAGAQVADSLQSAVQHAEVVMVSLPGPPQVAQVMLGDDGVLVLPTMPDIAPLVNEPEAALEDYRNRAIRLLCVAGLSGFPQLSLPLAGRSGAPLGLSWLGPAGSDRSLVRLAERITRG